MAVYQCIAILCLLAATASAQLLIICYQRDGCSSSGLVFDGVTIQDCCDNINGGGLGGIGLGASYQQDGVEGCIPCPVVLGFIPSVFIGIERGVTYSVQAGFLSGKPPQGGSLNLNLVLGTASARDVSASPRVQPRATGPLQSFQITLTVDGISQEFNETFSMELTGFDLTDFFLFPDEAPVTVNSLQGTIIDQDRVEFLLTNDNYRENEAPNAMMEIEVAKVSEGILANPVRFRIMPMTVLEAERLGILNFTRPADDDVSPSIADTNDFDATAIDVTFPADEFSNIAGVLETIPIVDDEIDEAHEQVFIILLEVLESVNSDLIIITRNTSFGRIIDNDAIRIGFALPEYSFDEPELETIVTDIVLLREGGRLSEQTFQVAISVGGTINRRPATLEFEDEQRADYRLTAPAEFIALDFPPGRQNITLAVILFRDNLHEGQEAFRATTTPSPNFPNFRPPSMGGAFQSTDVLINDDDPAVVGFVQSNYTVREDIFFVDVYIRVFNPPPDEDLIFGIDMIIQPMTGTADELDFFDRTIPAIGISAAIATGMPRETCAFVRIFDDTIREDEESFQLTLLLDPLIPQGGVIVNPDVATVFIQVNDVTCYERQGCSSSGLVFPDITTQECCDNVNGGGLGGIGLGVSFTRDGIECTPCPIVLGFNPSVFTGSERGETFPVQAGFFSGKPPQGGSFNLNLVLGTASVSDVSASPQVQLSAAEPLQTFQITLRVDGISQEFDETFSIEFTGFNLDDLPTAVPVNITSLQGTIIDQDRVQFSLTDNDFRQNEEPNAMMQIRIVKDGILANPVVLRVTPMTVIQAERLNIVRITRPADDNVSPSIADTNDFNATAFDVLFLNIANVLETIRIEDDEIDEAQEQVFIIVLEVLMAVKRRLIRITRSYAVGHIIDNDAIQIGFAQSEYSFSEPVFNTVFSNIVLVREGGRLSEQTFQVSIFVSALTTINIAPATLEFEDEDRADYRLTSSTDFIALNFQPTQQNITLRVVLLEDDLPEGTEGFRATSTPSPNFPNFGPPSMGGAFASTDVLIFDDDSAVVGFVQPNHTVSEDISLIEVCIQVFNPLQDEDLMFDIDLIIQPRIGDADGSDFLNQTIPAIGISASTATGTPRVTCAFVRIFDDVHEEDEESFELDLLLDPSVSQSRVIVDPNVTTIFIADNDGVVISFIDAPYKVSETDGAATVTFELVSSEQLMREVVVELFFSDGTAIGGSDYTPVGPISFTFNATVNQFSFDVPVIPDEVFEVTENLTATLSFPAFVGLPRASIRDGTTQISIFNNIPCSVRMYIVTTSNGSDVCTPCPANSVSLSAQSRECLCIQGYYRHQQEDVHIGCTRPPSAAQNFQVLQSRTRANSITVMWERPLITGRDDYFYNIQYSNPDNPGSFVQHNSNPLVTTSPVVRYSLSGLRPQTGYTIRLTVLNGVSDQDSSGEEGRMSEVMATTGDINPQAPRSVTSYCAGVVWQAPFRAYGPIVGYDVMFADGEDTTIITKDRDELFHTVQQGNLPNGGENVMIQVRAKTDFADGIWSEAISLNCMSSSCLP